MCVYLLPTVRRAQWPNQIFYFYHLLNRQPWGNHLIFDPVSLSVELGQ